MLVLIYLLIAILLTSGGSSTVHIYTQTIHRTAELTTLIGRLSGIRTQSGQAKINDELSLSLSLSNGATARGGSRPPSRVSSILPGLGRLSSNFYTLALLHLLQWLLFRISPSRLPSISPVFTLLVFITRDFSEVGESVQRSTPNLEDQGTSLSLTPTLRSVRQGWPYQ